MAVILVPRRTSLTFKSCGMRPGDFWIPTNSATFLVYVHMQQALKLSYVGCACAYLQMAQNGFGFLKVACIGI